MSGRCQPRRTHGAETTGSSWRRAARAASRTLLALVALWAVPAAPAADLEAGDWIVGGDLFPDPFSRVGGIWRVRDGQASAWCESPTSGDVWGKVTALAIDGSDRVVFLAQVLGGTNRLLPNLIGGEDGLGLFRCPWPGGPVEVLGLFPKAPVDPLLVNGPLPYPGETFLPVGPGGGSQHSHGGLHVAHRTGVRIDDAQNDGAPQVSGQDAYVLALPVTDMGGAILELRVFEYRTVTDEWGAGPNVARSYDANGQPTFRTPWMRTWRGDTYSATAGAIGRTVEGLGLTVKGALFELDLEIFGGLRLAPSAGGLPDRGPYLDDVDVPDVTECVEEGGGLSPRDWNGGLLEYSTAPVGFAVRDRVPLAHYDSIPYPRFARFLGFDDLVRRPTAPEHYFLAETFGCSAEPKLPLERLDDDRFAVDIAWGAAGAVGVGGVDLFLLGDELAPAIATVSAAAELTAVAAHPPPPSVSTAPTVAIRIDSPVDLLVTTEDGRRLGVAGGLAVNELEERGFDSGPGEPRIYALHGDVVCPVPAAPSPLPAPVAVEATGTAGGPYTVHVYTWIPETGEAHHIQVSDTLSLGGTANLGFSVDEGTGAVFFDRDGDGLADAVETGTGVFVGADDTGSDPDLVDTDGDGREDGLEVLQGTDPNVVDAAPVPGLPAAARALLAALLAALGLAAQGVRRG